jgi:hypothetical protein
LSLGVSEFGEDVSDASDCLLPTNSFDKETLNSTTLIQHCHWYVEKDYMSTEGSVTTPHQ